MAVDLFRDTVILIYSQWWLKTLVLIQRNRQAMGVRQQQSNVSDCINSRH